MEHKRYNTVGRTHLLAYLEARTAKNPQNAQEIYAGLCAQGEAPGRSSVYRMLSELVSAGEVKRYRAPAPATGFVYEYVGAAHGCDGHFHLHCLSCGGVTHLECGCGTQIADHLRAAHGFLADRGRSVFYGVCASCAEKGGATV